MRFWDTSAIVPLLLREETTPQMEMLLRQDSSVTVWWGTWTECLSALARSSREGLAVSGRDYARVRLELLTADWSEVLPSPQVRATAGRLLFDYALRAADALQLAAALDWCEDAPQGRGFVCLDDRLRVAARSEGFEPLP